MNFQCKGKSRKLLNLNERVFLSVIRIDYLKNQKRLGSETMKDLDAK